ncbi:MAG: FAD-binding oxidoreductase [Gemmatimonadota bacterium]|nr:FAD-binding oxidoreductase [Gemmatimonadota bacterium]
MMPRESADVVIVGGGVVGSSIAYHLRRDGFTGRIVVAERDSTYARASSFLAMGGVRQQFGSAANIAMAQYSIRFYREFDERMTVGDYISRAWFRQRGYLFLVNHESAERFERRLESQRALGAKVERLSVSAIRERLPEIELGDIAFGVIGPDDGYANPRQVLAGFRAGAAHQGVEYADAEVIAIEHDARGVSGVTLNAAGGTTRLATRTVVNAAGAYASHVGDMAGVDLPVRPQRQHLFRLELPRTWPYRFPMVIDPSGVHWRHDDATTPDGPDRIVVAKTNTAEPEGENLACDPDRFERDVRADLLGRMPAFADATVVEGWAGLYEMSPDHNAIIGEHPDRKGFYLANGFSGHGLMMAPATGKAVADLIRTGRSETIDISKFDLTRFARGEPFWDDAML